ncbi:MAG: hypothetical protein KBT21_03755 [Treponema sp.]|nr:hypothetical protein [Candidatus Treponema merdequi]
MLETIDKETKLKVKTYLIFTSLLIVMALLLTSFSLLARKNWNNQLRVHVETVLENSRPEEFPAKYSIGNPVKINSSISVSSNMYEITSKSNKTSKYVLITRITSYWGPLAAVFLYDGNGVVTFEGFVFPSKRIESQFDNAENELSIKYWKNKALVIFEQTLKDGEKK